MENEITDIGKVAITPRKDYRNEQNYEWLDVVTYDGAGYMCIAEDGCTGIVPTNTDYWQLLADKGHFTEEDKEEFKKAVVEESKTEINEHTGNKKTELNNYTTELEKSLKNELDTFETEKEVQLDLYKATLETEMANKKDSLIEEIETAQNGFDANVEEKTNTFNSNVETKTTEFNNNSNAKTEEFNNNSTEKINAFNYNAEEKIAEYDAHTEKLTNRIADLEEENSELVEQMPWNTTEVQESIHVEDAARYSKNKLNVFGNLIQDETVTIPIDIKKSTKNNYISQSGALADSSITDTTDYIEVKPDKTCTVNLTTSDTNFRNLILFDSNKAVIEGKSYKGKSFSFTTTESTCYVRFSYINTAKLTMTTEFDFNYSSMPVVATGVQKIKKYAKNLCKGFSNGSIYKYAASFYLDCNLEKGKYYALSFTDLSVGNTYYRNEYLTGDNGKYTSYSVSTNGKRQTWIFLCAENSKTNPNLYYKDKGYYFLKNQTQQENASNIVDVQLEEVTSLSDLASIYEKYSGEDITLDLKTLELCKIKKYGDYIYKNKTDENWYKKVVIYKKVLTGDENISNLYGQNLFNTASIPNTIAQSGGFSNFYKYNKAQSGIDNTLQNGEFAIQKSEFNSETKLFIKNTNFSDATSFKKFLKELYNANNPVIVYYPLENAIDEKIEDEKLIEQLEKLYKLSLEKGTSNIFVESENGVTTELQLEYMQDNNLKKEQENKALEDRITAIEALLSTTQTSALLLDNMQNDLESEVE